MARRVGGGGGRRLFEGGNYSRKYILIVANIFYSPSPQSPSPFSLPPYPLSPTPFDACYPGYATVSYEKASITEEVL